MVRVRPGTTEIPSPASGRWAQVYGRVEPWADDLVLDRARLDGIAEGTTLTAGPRFSLWRRSDGHFVADGIALTGDAVMFEHRFLEIDVAVVGRWRTERLRLVGPGSRGAVRCGPFILSAMAEQELISVSAESGGREVEGDRQAWRARVPLQSFDHGWISEGGLVARDRHGSRLRSSSSLGTGGSTSETFAARSQGHDADAGEEPEDFAWPVTLEVRIPEEVRMTTVRSDLAGLAVPP